MSDITIKRAVAKIGLDKIAFWGYTRSMETKTMNVVCKGWDPYYGFKIVPEGMRALIKVFNDGEIRVIHSENQVFPGWGYKLSENEYRQYFEVLK